MNDTYIQKIKEIIEEMDELDNLLTEYRNRQKKLEDKVLKLIEELHSDLEGQDEE